MPEISRFYGMVITMYAFDHSPPHFHVRAGGRRVLLRIDDLSVIRGGLSARQLRLVEQWASLHRAELMANWERLAMGEPPRPIAPLR